MNKILFFFFLILGLLTLVSCGERLVTFEPERATSGKKPVTLDSAEVFTFDFQQYSKNSDTFTFFYFPKFAPLDIPAEEVELGALQESSLTRIVNNVLTYSEAYDDADRVIYANNIRKTQLESLQNTQGCLEDDLGGGDGGDDWDIGFSARLDYKADSTDELSCDEIQERIDSLLELEITKILEKEDHIKAIQTALDGREALENPELFENWQEYGGDANLYVFDLTDPTAPNLYFPNLGNPGQEYSTEAGDVYDVNLGSSKYNANVKMLYFKLKEKNAEGQYTGNYIDCELEQMDFLNKIRFTGDAMLKNADGEILRHGVMKFELPPIEAF